MTEQKEWALMPSWMMAWPKVLPLHCLMRDFEVSADAVEGLK
jgi:hypothetical protein